jgi:hypothetical protein
VKLLSEERSLFGKISPEMICDNLDRGGKIKLPKDFCEYFKRKVLSV